MGNERDELSLLYDLSEESIISKWDGVFAENAEHDFSDKYKNMRQRLIKEISDSEHEKNATNNKSEIVNLQTYKLKKKWEIKYSGVTAAAIAVSALIFSMSVYAVVHLYNVYFKENEDGSYTYQVNSTEEILVHPIRLELNYVPEGYEFQLSQGEKEEDGIKKYKNMNGEGGFSVFVNDNYKINQNGQASEVEKINLGGVEAVVFIVKGNGENVPYRIDMHYTEIGHVVSLYGQKGLSLDELKKVAENLEVTEVEDESYTAYADIPETDFSNPLGIKKGIIDEESVVSMGTVVDLNGERSIKITNIEYLDNISSLPKEYFSRDLSEYLNEDGTFKPVELIEKTWEDNMLVTNVVDTWHIGFVYLTLEVTNLTDKFLEDEFVWVDMAYRNPDTKEIESAWIEPVLDGISMDEPVYYDSTNPTNDSNIHTMYVSDFEPYETRTVHMGLLYVKEREDDAYISMRSWIGNLDDCYVKLIE